MSAQGTSYLYTSVLHCTVSQAENPVKKCKWAVSVNANSPILKMCNMQAWVIY